MRELFPLDHPSATRAPLHVLEKARARNAADTKILHIVWDKEGGYPESTWGYEQWSVRPYELGQGCDGTTVPNTHFVALSILSNLGVDYRTLYEKAYPGTSLKGWPSPTVAAQLAEETRIPAPSPTTLTKLLHDLYDTNHRSLENLVRTELQSLGLLQNHE